MTDINDHKGLVPAQSRDAASDGDAAGDAKPKTDPALLGLAELLFFAYRDFISEPDKILAEYGFGRAHHRVLHFVNRHPGLRVADLLDILKITKQSLGRVLKQLVDDGFIAQEAGKTDRRERRLFTTPDGRELAARLAAPQLERISSALEASGVKRRAEIATFLREMISADDRGQVDEMLKRDFVDLPDHRDKR